MLHYERKEIRDNLLKGCVGLEKESLRIDHNGFLSQTKHPFDSDNIVRDFSEAQTEINTPVCHSVEEAYEKMRQYTSQIQHTIRKQNEYLWPFSNPPYIRNEKDILVAQFLGESSSKTSYREYLATRYGRYKMCFSGIHFNYSFDENLLKTNFSIDGKTNYQEAKNEFYLDLSRKLAIYGWLLVSLTAASPILDSSYVQKGVLGQNHFNGMASSRCSELGYWNYFTPVFDYSSVENYAQSIQNYVDQELLQAASELYYPIRLKPAGPYSLDALKKDGVSHIELRMMDLNPLQFVGMDIRDLKFFQLFLVWLACLPDVSISDNEQVQAAQNFKNAAHYDLMTVQIVMPHGPYKTVVEHGKNIINSMQIFYREYGQDIQDILQFEKDKFLDEKNRYAYQIHDAFEKKRFVEAGLELCAFQQEQYTTTL